MDKEDVIHIDNGIFLGHEQEWNSVICRNIEIEEIVILRRSIPEESEEKYHMTSFLKKEWYKWTYRKKLIENEFLVAGGEKQAEGTVREFGMDMYTLLYMKYEEHM